jgi:hypothetical protein
MYTQLKRYFANRRLKKSGLIFARTKLSQATFIPKEDEGKSFATKMIFPDNWTKEQLRAIADYMDAFPDCTILSDGSGKKCK